MVRRWAEAVVSEMLWICLALLTAAVVFALARPLGRPLAEPTEPGAADLAVYRDQLAEIDSDRDRGLIAGVEADAARAEVARRVLQRQRAAQKDAAPQGRDKVPSHTAQIRAVQGLLAALPVAGIALYLSIGDPSMPGQPLASRQAAPTNETPVGDLIAKVEEELKRNPADARGWEVIAPVYMSMKRYDDAAYAFSQIIRLKGETFDRLMGFAEAGLLANKGVVNDGIKRAAERLKVLAPDRFEPRVWLALGKEQEGDVSGAIADYKSILADAPEGAPWIDAVAGQVKRLESGGQSVASSAPASSEAAPPVVSRPSADAIAALPPEEQQKQIAAMVEGLAQRLKQNGDDLGGWQRLVRAYQVMGRKDDAVSALASARKQFADKPEALAALEGLAKSLGL